MKHFMPAVLLAGSMVFLSAQAQAEPLKYELLQMHLSDQPAQMRVIANEELTDVDVAITRCAPQVIRKHLDIMKKGSVETLKWMQAPGKHTCGIRITATGAMGTVWTVDSEHEFISTSQIDLYVNLRELSPEMSDVMLRSSRKFNKASIVVTAEDGSKIDSVEKNTGAVSEYRISWTPNGKKPALLEIKIEDNTGAWASNTIMYFQIPHTDVVFDTNKYDIRADQEGYLQEALDRVQEIVRKFDHVAADLYITGHTDTVGSAASNEKLSMNRAHSIASWFARHGLSIPVYYRGAGERSLAVNTPDNTPNEANRRAVYILSNNPPIEEKPLGAWKKL
ncbi:MAG: OmpA family protein [Proteobacteria bacterium]|nr:OmpA family protein [Pseudomonadota bacterium]